MENKQVVVVLGMHRSGTSTITKAIEALGANLDTHLMPPLERNNPKGFFEDMEVHNLCERILATRGLAWDSLYFHEKSTVEEEEFVSQAERLLKRKTRGEQVFCMKNPRLCLVLPVWQRAFERLGLEPKYVFAVREPAEVAASLNQRDGYPLNAGLLLWANYNIAAMRFTGGETRTFVAFDQVVANPRDTLAHIAELLGFASSTLDQNPAVEFVSDFVESELKHHNTGKSRPKGLPAAVMGLRDIMFDLAEMKLVDGDSEYESRFRKVDIAYTKLRFTYQLAEQISRQFKKVREQNQELKVLLANKTDGDSDSERRRNQSIVNGLLQGLTSASEDKHSISHLVEQALGREMAVQFDKSQKLIQKQSDQIESALLQLRREQQQRTETEKSLFVEYQKSVDKLNSEVERLKEKRDQLVVDLNRAGKKYTKFVKSAETASTEQEKITKRREQAYKSEIKILKGTIRELRREVEVYQNSMSLKLTAPLRGLRKVVSRGIFAPLHVATSRTVRVVWRAVPGNTKTGIKDVLFARLGALFSRTSAYRDWVEHKELLVQNNFANERELKKPVPKAAIHPLTQADQIWDSKSRLSQLFKKVGEGVFESPPSEVLLYARELVRSNEGLKISVIVPTWNREKTVCSAIDSILRQSYPAFETIISDDGSSDSTIAVLKTRYSAELRSGLIKIVENKHEGVSAARNAGMALATGDVFCYLDSDNEWRSDFLLLIASAFLENDELNTVYAGLSSYNRDLDTHAVRASYFDRNRLLEGNFIDLNIFAHRKVVFDLCGGFDLQLKRLVDWELIIRYTKNFVPLFIPCICVDYYLSAKELNNITHTVPLDLNRNKVLTKHIQERFSLGLESLRIAYFVYDYPALSQSFVFNEIRWLVEHGHDVIVYYHVDADPRAQLDFEVPEYQVGSSDELSQLLVEHKRNVCHTQFAYPGAALFVRPACAVANVRYTFMPHAVDIFHHKNQARNKVGEVACDELCMKVFVYGDFHRSFLVEAGVPEDKITYAFQSVDVEDFGTLDRDVSTEADLPVRAIVIARFIQKKGIEHLLHAMKFVDPSRMELTLYGWGPLEEDLRGIVDAERLSNVKFGGSLKGAQDLKEIYSHSDILIAPSVRADDGDMDGFPTVILEAIAVGLPVLTTSVSAIPDYLRDGVDAIVVEPGSARALAGGIERYLNMSGQRRAAMVRQARQFLKAKIGTDLTMRQLIDVWSGYTIEIVLVTFNVDGYDDREETFEIVRRILLRTTTCYTLTIVDNNSDPSFRQQLTETVSGHSNVRLLFKSANLFCGPATNLALQHTDSEFLIYICSKEGFVKKHGWERPLLNYMRQNEDVAIAGHLTHLPNYTYGAELVGHPDFEKFRERGFARQNPNRAFQHVQGGIFIARSSLLRELGGFNPKLPQSNMDVELSYFLEARGYKLGDIPEVSSVTVKTLPNVQSLVSEQTTIAHPYSLTTVKGFDALDRRSSTFCNLCLANSTELNGLEVVTSLFDQSGSCLSCGVTPFGRMAYRVMSSHYQIHKKLNVAVLTDDERLVESLGQRMFARVFNSSDPIELAEKVAGSGFRIHCAIVDGKFTRGDVEALSGYLEDGLILFYCDSRESALLESVFPQLEARGMEKGLGLSMQRIEIASRAINFDWRPMFRIQVQSQEFESAQSAG
ncbi:MAG: glycosyltransferase [Pseudomonadales bacterium]